MAIPYSDPWPTPKGFKVASIATSIESSGTTYGPWTTDSYGIAWIIEGGGVTHYDDREIETQAGSVLCVRPGVTARHDWGTARTTQAFFGFYLDQVSLPWPDPESWPLVRHFPSEHVFFSLFRSLLGFDFKDESTHPIAVPLAELIVRLFVSDIEVHDAQVEMVLPKPVERAVRFMKRRTTEHPEQTLTLAELADEVHVTRQHLTRLFKGSLGLSPMECVQALRLEQATTLIERTELPLAQIAAQNGFSSQFYFSKVFKQAYGMSPNAYRKAFRTGVTARPPGLMFRNHPLRNYFYEEAPGKILQPEDEG